MTASCYSTYKGTVMKNIKLAILSLLVVSLTACIVSGKDVARELKGVFMKENKMGFSTAVFAPRYYPIELVAGESFWMYDDGSRRGFYAHAGGGWRTAGADASGGSRIPDGINLTWLAPLEGKYYHVRARLPKAEIEKQFQRKLTMDFEDTPNTERFKQIQLALAPGGFVSVRLGWAEVVEVAQFQAEEVDIPWEYFAQANHFNPEGLSEEEYLSGFVEDQPEEIQSQKAKGSFPIDRWKTFNTQKFPWYLSTPLDVYGYTEFLINGEDSFVKRSEVDLTTYKSEKAVPAWYRLYFKHEGKRYQAIIRLSQSSPSGREMPDGDIEQFEIFKTFFAENKKPAALMVNIVDGELVAYLTIDGIKKQNIPLHGSFYRLLKDNEYQWFK